MQGPCHQLSALSDSADSVTPVGSTSSRRRLKADTRLMPDMHLLTLSLSLDLCKFEREGLVKEGTQPCPWGSWSESRWTGRGPARLWSQGGGSNASPDLG